VEMKWDDSAKKLRMRLAEKSKMLGGANRRKFELRVGEKTKEVEFAGKPIEIAI
jgi:hypothetical protein